MQRLFVCSLFLAVTGLLFGADDKLAGTWKLNVAKSKPAPTPPGRGVKAETIVIPESGETATVTISGTREDASAILTKYTVPVHGGPVVYSEGAPPAGVSSATKRIDDRTVDFITRLNGKDVSTNHVTVSADGKTMRLSLKGTDAQGKPVQSLA
ncbi:MAG: hypothetical protein ABSB35_32760, partial [Bryobacteraceae bacterium]